MSIPETTMFFQLSESVIGRDEFLTVYQEVYELSGLLMAPFGHLPIKISAATDTVERFKDNIKKDSLKVFSEWDELLCRAIFEERGYTQDQIVSSVNKYITGSAIDNDIQPDVKVKPMNLTVIYQLIYSRK